MTEEGRVSVLIRLREGTGNLNGDLRVSVEEPILLCVTVCWSLALNYAVSLNRKRLIKANDDGIQEYQPRVLCYKQALFKIAQCCDGNCEAKTHIELPCTVQSNPLESRILGFKDSGDRYLYATLRVVGNIERSFSTLIKLTVL